MDLPFFAYTGIQELCQIESVNIIDGGTTTVHRYNTFTIYPAHALDLALSIADQLGCCASNGQLAGLLHLGLEGDLVAIAPHLGDESLAGDDDARKADLDVLEGTESGEGQWSSGREGLAHTGHKRPFRRSQRCRGREEWGP